MNLFSGLMEGGSVFFIGYVYVKNKENKNYVSTYFSQLDVWRHRSNPSRVSTETPVIQNKQF